MACPGSTFDSTDGIVLYCNKSWCHVLAPIITSRVQASQKKICGNTAWLDLLLI